MGIMDIKDFMDFAAKKYYEGQPVMSDEEFDALAEQHKYISVGTKHAGGLRHTFPMFSLQKVYEGESPPFDSNDVYISAKFDGAAIAITYIEGILSIALTRGDGERGQPITDLAIALGIPLFIETISPVMQITGEVVAPKSIKNARNYAAGALNLKSVAEFKTRDLTFIAYGVQPYPTDNYENDLWWIEKAGFATIRTVPMYKFPTDGHVYRIYDNKKFTEMGHTAHHPRGAYALKTRKEGIVTTLREVVWNVGRSGVVSPVGVFDPIEIDGAIVSRATLHNMKYIEALGLEEGCMVKVIRSGEIIPRITERVDP